VSKADTSAVCPPLSALMLLNASKAAVFTILADVFLQAVVQLVAYRACQKNMQNCL